MTLFSSVYNICTVFSRQNCCVTQDQLITFGLLLHFPYYYVDNTVTRSRYWRREPDRFASFSALFACTCPFRLHLLRSLSTPVETVLLQNRFFWLAFWCACWFGRKSGRRKVRRVMEQQDHYCERNQVKTPSHRPMLHSYLKYLEASHIIWEVTETSMWIQLGVEEAGESRL